MGNIMLTKEEAYYAMFLFLEDYYKRTKLSDIGALLGMMDTSVMSDGYPPERYFWEFWDNCVKEASGK
jgi:hypothetical protein